MKEPASIYTCREAPVATRPVFFAFEKDFVENGIRCIPMVVRLKMDLAGIKLKLKEWSKFSEAEREYLAEKSCNTAFETIHYRIYLQQLVKRRTGQEATELAVDPDPAWAKLYTIHPEVILQAAIYGWELSLRRWQNLSDLQRFALVKLCRPGHENQNFPKAMQEFALTDQQ